MILISSGVEYAAKLKDENDNTYRHEQKSVLLMKEIIDK